jgi:hypothetical protein
MMPHCREGATSISQTNFLDHVDKAPCLVLTAASTPAPSRSSRLRCRLNRRHPVGRAAPRLIMSAAAAMDLHDFSFSRLKATLVVQIVELASRESQNCNRRLRLRPEAFHPQRRTIVKSNSFHWIACGLPRLHTSAQNEYVLEPGRGKHFRSARRALFTPSYRDKRFPPILINFANAPM